MATPAGKVKAVSARGIYPIAIREDGTLMRWRQRGGTFPGDPYPGNIPVKAIASGPGHFMAIKEDGTVIQWGPTQFTPLPPVPEGTKGIGVACGYRYSVIIKEDGTLVQYGGYTAGLPEGVKVKAVAGGTAHCVAIKEDGTMVQWGDTVISQREGFPEGVKVKDIDCSSHHSSAIKEDGTILQWGKLDEWDGFLLDGPPEGVLGKKVSCESDHTVVIKEDDTMVAWGRPITVSMVPTKVKVKEISSGEEAGSLGIKEDGTLVEWGVNEFANYPDDYVGNSDYVDEYASEDEDTGVPGDTGEIEDAEQFTGRDYIEFLTDAAYNTLTPDPFPDYLKKITVDGLPKKKAEYTAQTTAFDPVMQSEVSIREALDDSKTSILVKVGDTYSALDREYIGNGIDDGTLIRFACTKDTGIFVNMKDVYGKNPFVYLKGLGAGNFMVLLEEYLAAEKETAIELVDTGVTFPNVASMRSIIYQGDQDVFGNTINLVGADHCQAGSQQKLYKIVVLDMVQKAGRRRKTRRIRKNKKKTRKQK